MAPARLLLPVGAELLPVPRCLVRDRAPCPGGIWGDSGSPGVCRISAAGSSCHLCGGLPGGGTAETDASQGKSKGTGIRDAKRRAHGLDGVRAWLRPTAPSVAVLSSPRCCHAGKPDNS